MNLNKLNESIAAYQTFLKNAPHHFPYWKWESQRIFQNRWDLAAPDLKSMLDQALDNSQSRRIWKREHYEPKDALLVLAEFHADFVRSMFHDLFDESREVGGRIDRFLFHLDELLREYRERHPYTRLNSHFHHDGYQMVSWYLCFRFPERYAPYHFEMFKAFMEKLGSRNPVQVDDIDRYFKVMRTVQSFLLKDETIVRLHRDRLDPDKHYTGETLLLAEDFARFVSGVKADYD